MRRAFSILIRLVFLGVLAACNQQGPPQGGPEVTAFPGDNGVIAFRSRRDGNSEIYVMNADGTNQTRLTNNRADDDHPAWSPDGSRIAFKGGRDIHVMNADGSDEINLTNSGAIDIKPAWSPNGTRIAFDSNRDGSHKIYVMNADGTNLTFLALGGDSAWSPDGTKIAFTSGGPSNPFLDIYVINADGTNLTNLTNNRRSDVEAAWSPDGSKIAFRSDRDLNSEIYVMNADGTNQTRLTYNPRFDFNPAWSPDGSSITFTSSRDGNFEIYVMNPDGTGQTNLTNHPALDASSDWQPLPVSNRPPTADAGGPYDGDEGVGIHLDGSGSDPDGDILTYAWSVDGKLCSFSDGSSANPSLLCGDVGAFTVTLHVDDGTSVATDSAAVSVRNRDPNIDSFGLDAAVIVVGQSVTATGDYSDVPADTLTGMIAWGDGGTRVVASPFSVSHAYTVPGDYDVLLTVEDDDGGSDGAAANLRVLSPSEAIGDLMERIEDLDLVKNTERSLLSLLEQVQNSVDLGNTRATLGKLGAFIHQVEAQRGKKIAEADADALIVYAESISASVQDLY